MVGARLRSLLSDLDGDEAEAGDDFASMSHDEVFELIDKEFGG